MTHRTTKLVLAITLGTIASTASAQSNDPAAERARLANQRIAAEAARRAGPDEAANAAVSAATAEPTKAIEAGDGAMCGGMPEIAPPPESPPPVNAADLGNASVPSDPAPAAVAAAAPAAPDLPPGAAVAEDSKRADAAPTVEYERQESGGRDVSSMLEELERLGQLRDAGYVTDEEFEQIKKRIFEGTL